MDVSTLPRPLLSELFHISFATLGRVLLPLRERQ